MLLGFLLLVCLTIICLSALWLLVTFLSSLHLFFFVVSCKSAGSKNGEVVITAENAVVPLLSLLQSSQRDQPRGIWTDTICVALQGMVTTYLPAPQNCCQTAPVSLNYTNSQDWIVDLFFTGIGKSLTLSKLRKSIPILFQQKIIQKRIHCGIIKK